jgi:hypothetical protein
MLNRPSYRRHSALAAALLNLARDSGERRDALLRVQDERKLVPPQTYLNPTNSGAGRLQFRHFDK